jgi:hypothetical protein
MFETPAKHLKTLESHCKPMQYLDLFLQNIDKTLAIYIYETPETYVFDMHVM